VTKLDSKKKQRDVRIFIFALLLLSLLLLVVVCALFSTLVLVEIALNVGTAAGDFSSLDITAVGKKATHVRRATVFGLVYFPTAQFK
jgi:hypothetical protein